MAASAAIIGMVVGVEIEEADMLTVKVQLSATDSAVTVFFDENLGDVGTVAFDVFVHFFFTVDKHYDVGVQLDIDLFAEV